MITYNLSLGFQTDKRQTNLLSYSYEFKCPNLPPTCVYVIEFKCPNLPPTRLYVIEFKCPNLPPTCVYVIEFKCPNLPPTCLYVIEFKCSNLPPTRVKRDQKSQLTTYVCETSSNCPTYPLRV